MNQESSEKEIIDIIKQDEELLYYLNEDGVSLENLSILDEFPVLENKSPQLCTDRLDGVLHTCYVWLHTHSLKQIKEVYDDLIVLENEYGKKEIGFKNQEAADKFVSMVSIYAKELQGNKNKYVMKYVSEIVKLAVAKKLISLNDLYEKTEKEVVIIFANNFASWEHFINATMVDKKEEVPKNFYVSYETKKRNVIPLVKCVEGNKRIINVSNTAKTTYSKLNDYHDTKFAYIKSIKELD